MRENTNYLYVRLMLILKETLNTSSLWKSWSNINPVCMISQGRYHTKTKTRKEIYGCMVKEFSIIDSFILFPYQWMARVLREGQGEWYNHTIKWANWIKCSLKLGTQYQQWHILTPWVHGTYLPISSTCIESVKE